MSEITIGGTPLRVSLGNYKRLKRAWKYIDAAGDGGFTTSTDAIVGVIAVGLDAPLAGEPAPDLAAKDPLANVEAFRIDWIDEHMTGPDIRRLKPFMNDLMIDSGLAEQPGEGEPAGGEASPSTEISTPSLPS